MTSLSPRFLTVLVVLAAGCAGDSPSPAPPVSVPGATADSSAVVDFDAPGLSADGVVGQTLYVPVYSHVYSQSSAREVDLAVTLSLRNTDPEHAITFGTIRYHDSNGQLVRTYPGATLAPLASRATVVDENDRTGGVGANMVVQWQADQPVSLPVAEAVMISTTNAQGISFVSRGVVIRPVQDAR